MKPGPTAMFRNWMLLAPRYLPFADAAEGDVPLGRLLRLSLFQITVGMAIVLLNGTLNRVMILELSVPAYMVALFVALPLMFAPFRALIGFKSDTHRSVLGWRRVPYIWFGTLLQFGGLAIMPFALLTLQHQTVGPVIFGQIGAGLAFLLVGAGLHTTQTAGLALATDLVAPDKRPRVVALLYVMLLIGMTGSALAFGAILGEFDPIRLIQVLQATAVIGFGLNVIALWKQEARNTALCDPSRARPRFGDCWSAFIRVKGTARLLLAVGLGTAAFSMQDILLEPFGGEILHLSVGSTTALTALLAIGTLIGFGLAARALSSGLTPNLIASAGALVGLIAFSTVIFSAPLESAELFRAGTVLIGFGGGLFAVGSLTAAMALAEAGDSGIALGVWGAVQASAAGIAIALGGALRDAVSGLAQTGVLGPAADTPAAGYLFVYHIEILLLFATLAVIGPLVSHAREVETRSKPKFGLAEFPG